MAAPGSSEASATTSMRTGSRVAAQHPFEQWRGGRVGADAVQFPKIELVESRLHQADQRIRVDGQFAAQYPPGDGDGQPYQVRFGFAMDARAKRGDVRWPSGRALRSPPETAPRRPALHAPLLRRSRGGWPRRPVGRFPAPDPDSAHPARRRHPDAARRPDVLGGPPPLRLRAAGATSSAPTPYPASGS